MERDGEGAVSKRRRSIDQLDTGVRDSIDWIVGGMGVELNFQHSTIDSRGSPTDEPPMAERSRWLCWIGTFCTVCSDDDARMCTWARK